MNYEERYKQAIEAAKRELHCCGSLDCDAARQIFRLFPELRESEDERIRKELIERFKWELKGAEEQDATGCSRQKDIAMFKRGIAWLEKQGETEDEDDTDFTIYHPLKNSSGKYECIPYSFYGSLTSFSEDEDLINFLRNCFYTEKECKAWIEKQGEQKPSWSEEDEKMFDKLYEILYRYGYSSHPEIELSSNESVNLISWLKSIKSNHWKPSEEQMSMLLAVLNDSNNITAESVHIALKSLYNDLKKL